MKAGDRVVLEMGDREGVPIVVTGILRVSRVLADGSDLMLYRLSELEPCAASALAALSARNWEFAVSAERDCELVSVASHHFRSLYEARTELRSCVLHSLGDRMDTVLRLAEWTSRLPLDMRLADLLVREGPEMVVSHQELASRLGCTRESVSRTLAVLEAEKLLTRGYRKLVVNDPAGLLSRASGHLDPGGNK